MPHNSVEASLPKYNHPHETQGKLSYANLTTLDLSEYDKPGGKEKLAEQLRDTIHTIGFFYITNIGLTQSQIDQQFAIAKEFFSCSPEEKLQYRAPLEEGSYNGYRPLGSVEVLPGLHDNLEFYNVFKFIPQTQRPQPQIILDYWKQIEIFHRHMHQDVTCKLLTLLAIILGLPEDTLVNGHSYEANCDSALRYMMYRARTADENRKYKDLYLRGHTDNGTLTYVFQQPVAALQVKRCADADWEYLRIPEGKVAVNIGDIPEFLSNGYVKAGIHRVIAPPEDQASIDRLGLLYFVRPSDRLPLKKLDSPFLKRMGYGKEGTEADLDIPASEWVRARVRKNWKGSVMAGVDARREGFLTKVFYT
ncbi:hypothetical protein QQS21_008599 [Conoideocrella luteorostrata]|uniref:Clavaminate synthase-like protein n=1 Tax=Conoideocrella luteorostrata TaxID=1105319 RepID=A0AAJ0CN05_9HYPO|nr:hypothetical protein QQS21_008599 [Conoideocrella luteorostrata]